MKEDRKDERIRIKGRKEEVVGMKEGRKEEMKIK